MTDAPQLEQPPNHENTPLTPSKPHHRAVMEFCVKEYYLDIKGCQNELERVFERYAKLDEPLRGIDYSTNLGVDTSCTNEPEQRLADKQEAWFCYCDVIEQVRDRLEQAKELTWNASHGEILWQHWVGGVKWSVIATRKHVDISTLRRWKAVAVECVYTSMPEEFRRYSIPNAQPK